MKKLALLILKIENYCWMREMSLSLSADIEENLNYPDWEPQEHQSLNNRKAYDPIYPTPPLGQDMTQGQFFKRSLAGLN